MPSVGNIAFKMSVKGHDILRWPFASVAEFKAKPAMQGIPFMGPWANRLDEQAFYANGRRYAFDMDLGNVRGAIPIHGFLTTNDQWKVVEVKADGKSGSCDQPPRLLPQPDVDETVSLRAHDSDDLPLQDGVLQVATRIENLSTDPMPVSIGYHPYFQLTDSTREQWTISVAAKTNWLLASNKVPTGETQPIESFLRDPQAAALKDYDIDHVFGDLVRDGSGRSVMSVKGKSQQIDVAVGPNYRAMVVYAPKPAPPGDPNPNASAAARNFVCFEPMAAITNAMNLAHKGLYKELQSIPSGGTWEESFWVRPRGF